MWDGRSFGFILSSSTPYMRKQYEMELINVYKEKYNKLNLSTNEIFIGYKNGNFMYYCMIYLKFNS